MSPFAIRRIALEQGRLDSSFRPEWGNLASRFDPRTGLCLAATCPGTRLGKDHDRAIDQLAWTWTTW